METGGYRYWVLVTNDHHRSPAELESEHRHKADVEAGMRELKSNFGLGTIRKHGFMANWAWLLLVCLGHNLCRCVQQLGRLSPGRDGTEHRAKRLRYRFLVVPALLVRSGRRLSIKLPTTYPNTTAFLRARHKILRHLPPEPFRSKQHRRPNQAAPFATTRQPDRRSAVPTPPREAPPLKTPATTSEHSHQEPETRLPQLPTGGFE